MCRWSAEGLCNVMLGVVPVLGFFSGGGGGCLGERGCDGMSLVGES